VKYSFITQHKNAYPISLQFQVLGVSRNGCYQYMKRLKNRPDDPEHEEMREWVKDTCQLHKLSAWERFRVIKRSIIWTE